VPLIALNKILSILLLVVFASFVIAALSIVPRVEAQTTTNNANSANQKPVIELPPITVFATKGEGDTYTQTSEVAWDASNDLSISPEKDGSYTISSTTNSYNINTLLSSLGKPKVNVDFGYAANSVSMNAAGKSTLSALLDAFNYLDQDVTLEITPTIDPVGKNNAALMKRRLDVLRKVIERSSSIDFKVGSIKTLGNSEKIGKPSQVWRIQVRRQS